MNVARKPTDTVQLKLRFPEALRRRLEREAARHGRSMSAEIIHRVEQSFHVPDQTTAIANAVIGGLEPPILEKLVEILERRLAATERKIFDYGAKTTEEGSK